MKSEQANSSTMNKKTQNFWYICGAICVLLVPFLAALQLTPIVRTPRVSPLYWVLLLGACGFAFLSISKAVDPDVSVSSWRALLFFATWVFLLVLALGKLLLG